MYLRKEAKDLLRDGCDDAATLRRALRASIEREEAAEVGMSRGVDQDGRLLTKGDIVRVVGRYGFDVAEFDSRPTGLIGDPVRYALWVRARQGATIEPGVLDSLRKFIADEVPLGTAVDVILLAAATSPTEGPYR